MASVSSVNKETEPARTGITGIVLVGVEPGCRLVSGEALAATCALVNVSWTGRTIGDPWQGQHIRRAREKKTAWATIFIDRLLSAAKIWNDRPRLHRGAVRGIGTAWTGGNG